MTEYLDAQDPNSLANKVRDLESRLKQLENRGLVFGALDEVTNDIGVQTAGEFRTGEGEPGAGFTGGRFGSPGFLYNGKFWFLTGVSNDRFMVGLDLETGEIAAAGGSLTIGEQGIVLEGLMSAILQKAVGGWLEGELQTRYGKLGMFLPDGSNIPAFGMGYFDDVSGLPVMANGLFGSGDLTGWTASLGAGTKFSVITDKLPNYVDGYVLESAERPLESDTETLSNSSDVVTPGDKYLFRLWTRDGYAVTDIPVNENLNIDQSNPTDAQGSLANFKDNAWLEAGYYAGQTEQRSLLGFDASEAADVTVVDESGIVYYIRKNGLTLGTLDLVIKYLLTAWDWLTTSWNKKNASNNWNTAGAKGAGTDVSAASIGTDSIVAASTEEGYRYTEIDPAVIQAWLDGDIDFFGLIMTGTTLSGNNAMDIGLKEKGVGAFIRITERPKYKVEINWYSGAGGTGTLIRTDIIASQNDIPSWNERVAILTVPAGAVSFTHVLTVGRGKMFQMANIDYRRIGISTTLSLRPHATIQDNDGTRRILSTVKELGVPTAPGSGFVAGVINQGTVSHGEYAGTVNTLTVSHTVDAGSDKVLIVKASLYSATAGVGFSGCTWDGNAMTLLDSIRSADNLWCTYIFGYKNPTSKTANIVLTRSGGALTAYYGLVASNYTNVEQTTTYGTTAHGVSTTSPISVNVTTEANDMVVSSLFSNGAATSGNTSDGIYNPGGNVYEGASHQNASGASTSISWSGSNVSRGICAIPLKPMPATGNVDAGDHKYAVTVYDQSGETNKGTDSSVVTVPAGGASVNVINIPVGQVGTVGRKLYRTKAGGSIFYLVATIEDNTTTTYADTIADADLPDIFPPLINYTSARPQLPKQGFAPALSFVSNATLTITATGVALLLTTSAANANDGDYFDSDVWVDGGTYTVYIHMRSETTAGKFDISLDEVSIATGQEGYAASAANMLITIAGVVVVGGGYHKLRLKINGKHASSSDYTMNLYSVTFKPAAH